MAGTRRPRGRLALLIGSERQRRGMSRREFAMEVRKAGRVDGLTTSESTVKAWETIGETPMGAALRALAVVLDRPVAELVALAHERPVAAPTTSPLEHPDDLSAAVVRLRVAYPQTAPLAVLEQIEDALVQARHLLAAGTRRDVQVAAAWLHLLAATARFDTWDRPAARLYRSEAERLARNADDPEILGWSLETAAHFALVDGEFRDALRYARDTQSAAPPESAVAVAGHLQEARSWSHLGSQGDAIVALERAGEIFERLPEAGRPGDHYGFDAPKFQFFASAVLADAGRSIEAERLARSVITACTHRPNTAANSRVTLALTLTQRGEIDAAAHEVASAIAGPRVHPDTLRRARELGRFLAAHQELVDVQVLQGRLASLARRIVNGGSES